MLAKRIIPTILHKNGRLVKGQKFINDRVIGHALQAARIHAMRGVDELMILDVTASQEDREPNYQLIESLAKATFTPLTVGGGIKTAEHIKELLRSGADKVCVKSMYMSGLKGYEALRKVSDQFGKSTIQVSLDINENWVKQWADGAAKLLESYGAGEILLQAIARDGTMQGYDLDLIKTVSNAVSIPVIASGGCSGYEDMRRAIDAGADAVAAGALFAFTDSTPMGASAYLNERGVEVR